MTNAELYSLIGLGVTLALGIGVYLNARFANRTGAKKLSLEEQTAADVNDDRIAERRLTELNRLYDQLDDLLVRVASLEAEREKDKKRMTQMERHLDSVERMVPSPPGPPPRPWLA